MTLRAYQAPQITNNPAHARKIDIEHPYTERELLPDNRLLKIEFDRDWIIPCRRASDAWHGQNLMISETLLGFS